jgi:CRISPR/Cas system-associated exonuclease Cas4 (RecB family)
VISIEEFVVIPELYVAGSLDAEVAIKMPNGKWRRYVVDFKGINDRGFKWVTGTDEAKDDNIKQVLCYMKARALRRGILLYDNKNTNLPQTYTVDFSSPMWEEAVDWIETVIELVQSERMPAKDIRCKPGTIMYDSCPFRKICWSNTTDTTDLKELAFGSSWQGIDVAWEKGMEIYSG